MISRNSFLALAITIATSSAAACGPSKPATDPGTSDSQGDGDAVEGDGGTADSEGGDATPKPAPENVEAVSVTPSKMVDALKKLGIDVNKFPDLGKLPLAKKKKLMPLFQQALGMDSCQGCHAEGDFKKKTKNVKMASGMWKHYVQDLKLDQGGTLFCDSCHAGNTHVLPRGDKDAMDKFMAAEYEGKLSRMDGEDHSCTTCHTDTMEFKVFKDVWGIK